MGGVTMLRIVSQWTEVKERENFAWEMGGRGP